MKLPDKLPSNLQEAKALINDIYDQVIDKVTEICNKGKQGEQHEKKAETPAVVPPTEVKPAEPEKPAAPATPSGEEKKG
jgi:hypothetical protein